MAQYHIMNTHSHYFIQQGIDQRHVYSFYPLYLSKTVYRDLRCLFTSLYIITIHLDGKSKYKVALTFGAGEPVGGVAVVARRGARADWLGDIQTIMI